MRKLIALFFILGSSYAFGQANPVNTNQKNVEPNEVPLTIEPKQNKPVSTNNPDTLIYNTAGIEVKPEYPGGIQAMSAFIQENFVIPKEIAEGKVKKTVFVMFVVEKDGSLSDIKIIRDAGYDTGKEALRVLKLMPKWLPGEQNGKHVRCLYSMPIKLNGK